MQEIVLDLETMGNGPDAAIVAIGAVAFDIAAKEICKRFYTVVSLESAVEAGGVMDASTVLWWMQQSDEARAALAEPGAHIVEALSQFSAWAASVAPCEELRVWGNGAAFDNVILTSAYRRIGKSRPWSPWNDRCYRTVKMQYPHIKIHRIGVCHNAVDDAESQAWHLIAMLSGSKEET